MARGFNGSNANYLLGSAAPVSTSGYPVTLLIKFKTASAVAEQCLLAVSNSASTKLIGVEILSGGVLGIVGDGATFTSSGAGTVALNQWNTACLVVRDQSYQVTGYNGVFGTPVTTTRDWTTTANRVSVGGLYWSATPTTTVNPFTGDLAEAIIIDAAITEQEFAAYHNQVTGQGRVFTVQDLRSGQIRGYWPLNDGTGDEANRATPLVSAGTFTLTKAGTVTQTTHPTVATYVPGAPRVLLGNQRVITLDGSTGIVLAGSHTWVGVTQWSSSSFPARGTQDYRAYLDTLASFGHNFTRVFTADVARNIGVFAAAQNDFFKPLPYARSATTGAEDGGNKWDLTTFDADYFDTLRDFVQYAATKGITVQIDLFEGLANRSPASVWKDDGHPFKSTNNINSINGDANSNAQLEEVYTLDNSAITTIQYAMLDHLCATVADLPNVIFNTANEPNAGTSTTATGVLTVTDAWLRAIADHVRVYELANSTYQHLILRGTSGGATNDQTPCERMSGGDAVSVGSAWGSYSGSATWLTPETAAQPLHVYDSDHVGVTSSMTQDVFWRAFMRGHGGLLHMEDQFNLSAGGLTISTDIRANLGYIRTFAARLHMATCTPRGTLASTAYCLATDGTEYLVYQPGSAAFTVDLSAAAAVGKRFNVEWLNTNTGAKSFGPAVIGGSAAQSFTSPFVGVSGIALLLTAPTALVARPAVVTRPRPFAPGLAR